MKKVWLPSFAAAAALICAHPAFAEGEMSSDGVDRAELPMPMPPFEGKVGETYKDSQEDWPKVP